MLSLVDLCREALIYALIIGAPVLIAGIASGLVVGLLQAVTQIQDQTVAFVPKAAVMAVVFVLCLPWLLEKLMEFTRTAFAQAAILGG
jgi:flagellar biosynthetic protein FliQ